MDPSVELRGPITEQPHCLREIYEALKIAVDTNNPATRTLQDHVLGSGQLKLLMEEARCYNSTAFEIMQLLCYRNKPAVQMLVEQGLMLLIERVLLDTAANRQVQLAALFLLSAVCAFSMDIHSAVLASKIINILVDICRDFGLGSDDNDAEVSGITPCVPSSNGARDGSSGGAGRSGVSRISCAVATLRNLCHNEAHHEQLVAAGVADVMCYIMHMAKLPTAPLPVGTAECGEACATPSFDSIPEFTALLSGMESAHVCAVSGPSGAEAKSRGTVESSRRSSMDSLQSWHIVPFSQQYICVRINAAMAVAILVGHDEDNPLLEMDVGLTHMMLDVLQHACRHELRYGLHWTVWKLSQAFANLAVCDKNKVLILEHGGVEVLGQCLQTKHAHMAAVQRYSTMCLWHLAFLDQGRELLKARLDIIESVRELAVECKDAATRDVSNGCLWTLGVTHDLKALHQYIHNAPLRSSSITFEDPSGWLSRLRVDPAATLSPEEVPQPHLMISYCWDSQQKALLLKQELCRLGFRVWMDVEKMSGSTLEAMALAVENSAAVLVCYSRKYKESQACRTEAEYAFQLQKRVIPILLEADYRPTGWLGALLGTKLYFDCSDRANIPLQILLLERELGSIGRSQDRPSIPLASQSTSGNDKMPRVVRGLHGSHSSQQLPQVSLCTASSCPERDSAGGRLENPVAESSQGRLFAHSESGPADTAAEGVERSSNGMWQVGDLQCARAADQTTSDPGSPLGAALRAENSLLGSATDAAGQLLPEQSGNSISDSEELDTLPCLAADRFFTASTLSHRLAPVERWTQEQVADWLSNAARLPELVPIFQGGCVDGRGLCGLIRLSRSGSVRACLREDLGITVAGQMLAFIEELHKLFD